MQKYRGRGSRDWCKVIWGETGRECKAKALHWTQNWVSCSVSNCTNNTATTCRRREVGGWGDPLGEPKWLAGVNKWDLKTTCRNKYLASVDSVRDKRDNQQHIKDWIYFPFFFRHFSVVSSQFGPNLGGEWCHQPWVGFIPDECVRRWTSASLLPHRWPIIVPPYKDCSLSNTI